PIQAQHFTPAATMLAGNDRAMAGHQSLGVPTGLKYGGMHRSSRRGGLAPPDLEIVESLQGLVRAKKQARHVATDMVKACLPTEEVAIGSHPPTDCLWHSDNWQHAWRPGLSVFSSGFPYLLLSPLQEQ